LHLTNETAGNGLVTSTTYNANNGLIQTIQAGASNAVANFSYYFNTQGDLTSRVDATQGLTEAFCYDFLHRLRVYGTTAVDCQAMTGQKTMTYDALGNITSKSDTGSYSYPAAGNALPHAVAAIMPAGTGTLNTSYSYDANGGIVAGGGRSVTWTAANMVAQITAGTSSVSFAYGPDHKRIRQATSTQTTYYLGGVEKVVGTGGDVTWNEYLTVGGTLVGEHFTLVPASGPTTAKTRYFILDHLGSVAIITDESAIVAERLSFDAWGKRRFANGADDPSGSIASQTTKGFTGHEMVDQVGLINMNARLQDPAIGKFVSADPIIQDMRDGAMVRSYPLVRFTIQLTASASGAGDSGATPGTSAGGSNPANTALDPMNPAPAALASAANPAAGSESGTATAQNDIQGGTKSKASSCTLFCQDGLQPHGQGYRDDTGSTLLISDGQFINKYSYTVNNPLALTDPTGECPPPWCTAAVGAVIGGLVSAGLNTYEQYKAVQAGTQTEIDGNKVLAAGVGGAISGALIGSGRVDIAVASVLSAVGNVGASALIGKEKDPSKLIAAGVSGLVTPAVGKGVGVVVSEAKEALQVTVKSFIATGVEQVGNEIAGSALSNKAGDGAAAGANAYGKTQTEAIQQYIDQKVGEQALKDACQKNCP
jgi:RHS repeat-associated protein